MNTAPSAPTAGELRALGFTVRYVPGPPATLATLWRPQPGSYVVEHPRMDGGSVTVAESPTAARYLGLAPDRPDALDEALVSGVRILWGMYVGLVRATKLHGRTMTEARDIFWRQAAALQRRGAPAAAASA